MFNPELVGKHLLLSKMRPAWTNMPLVNFYRKVWGADMGSVSDHVGPTEPSWPLGTNGVTELRLSPILSWLILCRCWIQISSWTVVFREVQCPCIVGASIGQGKVKTSGALISWGHGTPIWYSVRFDAPTSAEVQEWAGEQADKRTGGRTEYFFEEVASVWQRHANRKCATICG